MIRLNDSPSFADSRRVDGNPRRLDDGTAQRCVAAPISEAAGQVAATFARAGALAVAALPSASLLLLTLSGVLWSGAFGVFLVGFSGMLLAPRVDGRPG